MSRNEEDKLALLITVICWGVIPFIGYQVGHLGLFFGLGGVLYCAIALGLILTGHIIQACKGDVKSSSTVDPEALREHMEAYEKWRAYEARHTSLETTREARWGRWHFLYKYRRLLLWLFIVADVAWLLFLERDNPKFWHWR
jgi:hypothetical protein